MSWLRRLFRRWREKPAPVAPYSIRGRLVRIAKAEVGTMEVPRNSNKGKRVLEYMAVVDPRYGLPATGGWPWCAVFVCWCIREALGGALTKPFRIPRTPRAWELEDWGEAEGLDVVYDPRASDLIPGDVITFDHSHCGIVVAHPKGGRVATCEGNTDQSKTVVREGGGVYLANRSIKSLRARVRLPDA